VEISVLEMLSDFAQDMYEILISIAF